MLNAHDPNQFYEFMANAIKRLLTVLRLYVQCYACLVETAWKFMLSSWSMKHNFQYHTKTENWDWEWRGETFLNNKKKTCCVLGVVDDFFSRERDVCVYIHNQVETIFDQKRRYFTHQANFFQGMNFWELCLLKLRIFHCCSHFFDHIKIHLDS